MGLSSHGKLGFQFIASKMFVFLFVRRQKKQTNKKQRQRRCPSAVSSVLSSETVKAKLVSGIFDTMSCAQENVTDKRQEAERKSRTCSKFSSLGS